MDENTFKRRTKGLGLQAIRLVRALPRTRAADVIGRQLLRSATSVGANYRASCRAKSVRDMIAKLGIVEEEADESVYWMELLVESGIVPKREVDELIIEASEILAMVVASIKTLKKRT